MRVLEALEPNRVFYYFEEICKIPHGSYHTKEISDYCVSFAKAHNLTYFQDELNNVIIQKEASKGMEHAPTLIFQGHLDMVCEKNEDVVHDFLTEPLKLYIDGDYIRAKGTTLGADDGIAVAFGLAILEDETLAHPPLEILFTTEEEVGMEGAFGLDASKLKGKYLLNLDSEDEGVLTTSCAGGATVMVKVPNEYAVIQGYTCSISVTGLQGGHSGTDINNGRENANIVLGKLLYEINQNMSVHLMDIRGGLKNNAIPREAKAVFCIANEISMEQLNQVFEKIASQVKHAYETIEPDIKVSFHICESEAGVRAFTKNKSDALLSYLVQVPNGVQAMSPYVDGLVETSLNLGVISMNENTVELVHALRSSEKDALTSLVNQVKNMAGSYDMQTDISGEYPGWAYKEDSSLRKLMVAVYKEQYGTEPKIEAIHAGLECGILAEKIPGLDIISTGPDCIDIHTPMEKLSISSVKRTWEYIRGVLEAFYRYCS